MVFYLIGITILARLLNILICSKIANITRKENVIDGKKQFFLWFAGVRGAMAFALALKSKTDFEAGKSFLMITLIFTSFTLIYSSIFLDLVIRKCNIIEFKSSNEEDRKTDLDCFNRFKNFIGSLNDRYLKALADREEEGLLDRNQRKPENKKNLQSINLNVIDVKDRGRNSGLDQGKTDSDISDLPLGRNYKKEVVIDKKDSFMLGLASQESNDDSREKHE